MDRLVTRLGSESGSTIAAIRRLLYFDCDSTFMIASMYCVLYLLSPSLATVSSPWEPSAAQSGWGGSYPTIVITTGWPPVACEPAASRCPASVLDTPAPPVTAAIRSSQTAVGNWAT